MLFVFPHLRLWLHTRCLPCAHCLYLDLCLILMVVFGPSPSILLPAEAGFLLSIGFVYYCRLSSVPYWGPSASVHVTTLFPNWGSHKVVVVSDPKVDTAYAGPYLVPHAVFDPHEGAPFL